MRSILDHFNPESFILINKKGNEQHSFKGLYEKGKITTEDTNLQFNEGDTIERKLPNGSTESYEIADCEFQSSFHEIPEMFEIKIQKVGRPSRITGSGYGPVFNVQGNVERLYVESKDFSINIKVSAPLFDEILSTAQQNISDDNLLRKILSSIEDMKDAKNKETFFQKYQNFLTLIGAHVNIFASFLPELSKLLV